jgi:hypothetical protein
MGPSLRADRMRWEEFMRRVGAGTVAALLWLGLVVPVAPAQSTSIKPEMVGEEGSWWSSLFTSKPKPDPKKAERATAANANRSREQERLRNAYLRRQAVCDRLLDIAEQTNNTTLKEEAERLDELAWKLYQEQSTRLANGASDPPEPPPQRKSAPAKGKFRGGEGALSEPKEEER